MQEYSRILIERYCMEHNSAKSRRLRKLVEMSYDLSAVGASGRNLGRLCGMFPFEMIDELKREYFGKV